MKLPDIRLFRLFDHYKIVTCRVNMFFKTIINPKKSKLENEGKTEIVSNFTIDGPSPRAWFENSGQKLVEFEKGAKGKQPEEILYERYEKPVRFSGIFSGGPIQ